MLELMNVYRAFKEKYGKVPSNNSKEGAVQFASQGCSTPPGVQHVYISIVLPWATEYKTLVDASRSLALRSKRDMKRFLTVIMRRARIAVDQATRESIASGRVTLRPVQFELDGSGSFWCAVRDEFRDLSKATVAKYCAGKL